MSSKDFLLRLCPVWHETITSLAEKQGLTLSQVIRNSIQRDLNLPEDLVESTYRSRPTFDKPKKLKPETNTTRVTLASDLPRYMDLVLKYAAKQKNWSVSSLVCMVLYKKIPNLPSRPAISPFNEGMVKRIPLEQAPSIYYMRASIPADWMPVIQEHAEFNGQKVSHIVKDALIESLGNLKSLVIDAHNKAIADESEAERVQQATNLEELAQQT